MRVQGKSYPVSRSHGIASHRIVARRTCTARCPVPLFCVAKLAVTALPACQHQKSGACGGPMEEHGPVGKHALQVWPPPSPPRRRPRSHRAPWPWPWHWHWHHARASTPRSRTPLPLFCVVIRDMIPRASACSFVRCFCHSLHILTHSLHILTHSSTRTAPALHLRLTDVSALHCAGLAYHRTTRTPVC